MVIIFLELGRKAKLYFYCQEDGRHGQRLLEFLVVGWIWPLPNLILKIDPDILASLSSQFEKFHIEFSLRVVLFLVECVAGVSNSQLAVCSPP